ncbi:MAG: T9SS type A sorting domain-containing protein, partial [Bacteroidota bacterium]
CQTTSGDDIIPGHTSFQKDFWKLAQAIDSLPVSIGNPGNERRESVKVKIFPNPSRDLLNISDEALNEIQHIRIFDATGKLVDEIIVSDKNQAIDISKLSAGVYYVDLITKNSEIFGSRFIKE